MSAVQMLVEPKANDEPAGREEAPTASRRSGRFPEVRSDFQPTQAGRARRQTAVCRLCWRTGGGPELRGAFAGHVPVGRF
jgi:hypothetical protein